MQDSVYYSTSRQAEEAFYRAFQRGDIEMMMSVWSDDGDVVCIHPGGPRLDGSDAIRESWQQIFVHERGIRFEVTSKRCVENDVAIHHVVELISMHGEPQSEIIATNIYRKTKKGWRMTLHHASPELYAADSQPQPEGEVHTFH